MTVLEAGYLLQDLLLARATVLGVVKLKKGRNYGLRKPRIRNYDQRDGMPLGLVSLTLGGGSEMELWSDLGADTSVTSVQDEPGTPESLMIGEKGA